MKKVIPESVQQKWHEYRSAMKTAEKEELGDNHVSEDVEKVGWGVEKAQESYRADASKSTRSPNPVQPCFFFPCSSRWLVLSLALRPLQPQLGY